VQKKGKDMARMHERNRIGTYKNDFLKEFIFEIFGDSFFPDGGPFLLREFTQGRSLILHN